MKPTGRFNPFTGEEFLKVEEQDIDFWEKKWEELSDEQKVMFLSFIDAKFLGKQNEEHVKARYNYFKLKNDNGRT